MEQPGVTKVVIKDGFAGVVGESRAAAFAGVMALDLEWDAGAPLQSTEIEAMVQAGPGGSPVQSVGSAWLRLIGPQVIRAEYRTPMATHAPLEPQAALVDVRPDRVIAMVSTQSAVQVAQAVASTIGRDASTVSLIPTFLGGGFGRKLVSEAAVEAAILSEAAGVPVHVGWNRTEEFQNGYVRPPTHSILSASLDDSGQIVAIDHSQASGDVLFPFFPRSFQLLVNSDFGAWRGARITYNVPNISVSAKRYQLPIHTGSWRGLGLLPNTFALESFIDELAHAAGADPLAFRLRHLGDDDFGRRMRAVLQSAADRSGWGTPAPAGRARGIACCYDSGTVVAEVAEVSVVDGGAIRVHKVWAAVDPGLPINSDGVAAQTEGAITMGLSSTLKERLIIKDGKVEPGNFDRYPLLSMAEAPEIDVAVLRSGDVPFGMGEPPIGPIAAAVANAAFALTGKRLRELPLSLA
jgi:isoquinoline 1-oxidoreductase beta subunit